MITSFAESMATLSISGGVLSKIVVILSVPLIGLPDKSVAEETKE